MQFYMRLPAENLTGACYIRLASLRVALDAILLLVDNPGGVVGEGIDDMSKFKDRHFARVADVARVGRVCGGRQHQQAINALHEIGDITETAGLRAVAVD